MTIVSDIRTALGSYNVKYLARAHYDKPRSRSIKRHVYEVHVKHAADSDIESIVTALDAMTGYIAIIARCASSWPTGNTFYSRFEVEILQ